MIKLLRKYILIQFEEEETKILSGIVLSDNSYYVYPQIGIVLEAGEGVEKISKGNKVIFKKYSPDKIKLKEKEYLICEEQDIIAILD